MADTTRNEPPRLHIAHHQAFGSTGLWTGRRRALAAARDAGRLGAAMEQVALLSPPMLSQASASAGV